MIDHSELNSLALAVDEAKCADESEYGRRLQDFYDHVTPEEVLALIAKNTQLRESLIAATEVHTVVMKENEALVGAAQSIRDEWRKDQIEVEALRKNSDRYQWLRGRDLETIHRGGVFAGHTPRNVVLNGDDLDQAIDQAIREGVQS